jgi:hypothetical protein
MSWDILYNDTESDFLKIELCLSVISSSLLVHEISHTEPFAVVLF